MQLKSRETALIWITSIAAAGAAIWYLGIGPLYDQWATNQKALEDEQSQYEDNIKTLNNSDKIDSEYKKIQQTIPMESADQDQAQFEFTENVNAFATAVMKKAPAMGTLGVDPEPFKSIKKQTFVLINREIATDGSIESIAELLKKFDQAGYLVTKVSISQKDPDNPELHLVMTVSRIVQLQEKPKPKRKSH